MSSEEHEDLDELSSVKRHEIIMTALDAAREGRVDDVKSCLDQLGPVKVTRPRGFTGIARNAIQSNNSVEILQALLDHGWDINTPQSYFQPPLLRYV